MDFGTTFEVDPRHADQKARPRFCFFCFFALLYLKWFGFHRSRFSPILALGSLGGREKESGWNLIC